MSVKINRSIPRTMSMPGLEYLGRLAKSVPENGVIVEVGPLFGSSTWVLSKNAHPSVRIYSIDTWESAPWIEKLEAKYRNCKRFSLDAFNHYTRDCTNVTPIQGWSPDIVSDWSEPIDLFFDDATHGNPGFINNINFFLKWLKPDGILSGDDYAYRWPDIVREVDQLARSWDVSPEIIGRVWALAKPKNNVSRSVYSKLEKSSVPELIVSIKTKSGHQYKSSPNTWSGALHKNDPIESIVVDWQSKQKGVDFLIQYITSSDKHSRWYKTGELFEVPVNSGIVGIKAKLTGVMSTKFQLGYQLAYCYGNRNTRIPLMAAVKSPVICRSDDGDCIVSAILLNISPKLAVFSNKILNVANSVLTKGLS